MEHSKAFLNAELRSKGIRPSYHRVMVLEDLHRVQTHPTADEIFARLSLEIPSLSRATVYNTLNAFRRAGLVRVISINGVEKRYDITLHTHGHFKCERCGDITNFEVDIDNVRVAELALFDVREKNVYFHGACPKCLNQENGKRSE
jgi:Fe2+ or Zn2+ uptake regulation protein